MESLSQVTISFTLILVLSLLIERLLELLKTIYDMLDSRYNWYAFWNKRTFMLRDCLEKRVYVLEYVESKARRLTLRLFRDILLNGSGKYSGVIPIISGDMVRLFGVRAITKLIGISLGIMLAQWFDIDLVEIWHEASGQMVVYQEAFYEEFRNIVSGIVIGLGSGPIHKIIILIERQREKKHGRSN